MAEATSQVTAPLHSAAAQKARPPSIFIVTLHDLVTKGEAEGFAKWTPAGFAVTKPNRFWEALNESGCVQQTSHGVIRLVFVVAPPALRLHSQHRHTCICLSLSFSEVTVDSLAAPSVRSKARTQTSLYPALHSNTFQSNNQCRHILYDTFMRQLNHYGFKFLKASNSGEELVLTAKCRRVSKALRYRHQTTVGRCVRL